MKYLVTEDELKSATVNEDGELEFTRDNGEKVVTGSVKGPKGDQGIPGPNTIPTKEAVIQAVSPGIYIGPDGTGNATTDVANIRSAIEATPEGATLNLRGDYVVNDTVEVVGKTVTLALSKARFIKNSDAPVFDFKGAASPVLTVSGTPTDISIVDVFGTRAGVQFTVTGASSWRHGDVVKLVSDDVITGTRPGTGGAEQRSGQFLVVHSVSGTTVKCMGTLRETFSTNVRVMRMPDDHVAIVGGTFDVAEEGIDQSWKSGMIRFSNLINPSISQATIKGSSSFGFQFRGCYGYLVDGCTVDYGLNNDSTSAYCYAVTDLSSWFGKVRGLHAKYVRHAFTDAGPWVAANASDIAYYGRTFGTIVSDSTCHSSTNTAWDTHSWSENVTFQNCTAFQCFKGFALRGKKHFVRDCAAIECDNGGLWIFNENTGGDSWGHEVTGLTVDGSKQDAIYVNMNPTGHPNAGTRETRENVLRDIRLRNSGRQSIRIVNGTVRMEQVYVQTTATISTASTRIIELTNSVVRVPTTLDLDLRPLSSATTIRVIYLDNASRLDAAHIRYEIEAANASLVERIIFTAGSGAVDVDSLEVSHHPSGFAVHTGMAAGSKVGYRVKDNGRSSALVRATTSDVSGAGLGTSISISPDPVVTARMSSTSTATIAGLLTAHHEGQMLILMNAGSTNITIPHGVSSYKIDLKGAADIVLAPRDSLRLVWDGQAGAWRD